MAKVHYLNHFLVGCSFSLHISLERSNHLLQTFHQLGVRVDDLVQISISFLSRVQIVLKAVNLLQVQNILRFLDLKLSLEPVNLSFVSMFSLLILYLFLLQIGNCLTHIFLFLHQLVN